MTNCIICHKELCEIIYDNFNHLLNDFVCICFDCIKKQNKT